MIECLICNEEFENIKELSSHVIIHKDIETFKDYYDKFIKTDNDGICSNCGVITKFNGYKGYRKYCCQSCANKHINNQQIVKDKIKKTNKEKYGNENYVNVNAIREAKLKKYGYEYFPPETKKLTSLEEIERINKIKETKIEKYGNENYCNVEKIKETKLKKYGVETFNNVEKAKITNINKTQSEKENRIEKIIQTQKMNYLEIVKSIIKENDIELEVIKLVKNQLFLKCLVCQNEFSIQQQMFRLRFKQKQIICTSCNPFYQHYSKSEKDLFQLIKSNIDIEVLENVKNIISPYELDIYIPEKKLAFEFNGLFWHNELYTEKNYHLMKTELCEKQGIHLVHIYEDDWNSKREIVESRILNLLGKSKKIFARKCQLKEVISSETRDFVDKNHLQGKTQSKINIGLYYNDELISIMTFGKPRLNLGVKKSQDNEYELLRFCNKLNTTVIGGANKLFNEFIKKYNPTQIISYADRSWTMNNDKTLYDTIGFTKTSSTEPNYFYIIENKRKNRFGYRKDVLVNEGFDKTKTEHEIMLEREIYRIYDSGNLKYTWIKK